MIVTGRETTSAGMVERHPDAMIIREYDGPHGAGDDKGRILRVWYAGRRRGREWSFITVGSRFSLSCNTFPPPQRLPGSVRGE